MGKQYVVDPYAYATHVLFYITKGNRGISKLLEPGHESVSQKEGRFLNAVEISVQEAVNLVLQMPKRRSSQDFQSYQHLNSR